jgi:hypothetical protein
MRNSITTGDTADSAAVPAENPGYPHSRFVFIPCGGMALEDLKGPTAKLQRAVPVILVLEMAVAASSVRDFEGLFF